MRMIRQFIEGAVMTRNAGSRRGTLVSVIVLFCFMAAIVEILSLII